MITSEQCKAYLTECKVLGTSPEISSSALPRSWAFATPWWR
jgi:hypothetical protein